MKALTIGQVARRAGVGVETIRSYESRGLIEEPPRKLSGYRQYDKEVVRRIRSIKLVPDPAVLFQQMSKSTQWRLVSEIELKFQTFHTQGMLILDEKIYLSSVGFDPETGEGQGYLFKADMNGELLMETRLGKGNIYHPGGIDFDGENIWVPVAEFRPGPKSLSIIYKVDPSTMRAWEVTDKPFNDHIGALVCHPSAKSIYGVNWGSRNFYKWVLEESDQLHFVDEGEKANPNHFIDYQDCHSLNDRYFLCAGVNRYQVRTIAKEAQYSEFALGGLALIEYGSLNAVHLIPVPIWLKQNYAITNNPFYYNVQGDHLRFYFIPEDYESTLYIYDAYH